MNAPKNRFVWADIAKGVAICAVVAFHTGYLPLQHQLLPLMTPWMLPVFAILHGMLSSNDRIRTIRATLHIRFYSYMLPYVIYGLVGFMLWIGVKNLSPGGGVLDIPWTTELTHLLTGGPLVSNGPLWFLPSFFIASVVFVLTKQYLSRLPAVYLTALSFGVVGLGILIHEYTSVLPFAYDLSIVFLGFMVFGLTRVQVYSQKSPGTVWVALAVIFVVLAMRNGTIDLFERRVNAWPMYWLTAIIGSLILIRVSQWVEIMKYRWLGFIGVVGQSSVDILSTHWPLMQWITVLLNLIGIIPWLRGVQTYTSFSYYIENKYIFTIIEMPLLLLYFIIPFLILPLRKVIHRIFL